MYNRSSRYPNGSDMCIRKLILVVLLLCGLSGCAWMKSHLPRRKEVPVTPPGENRTDSTSATKSTGGGSDFFDWKRKKPRSASSGELKRDPSKTRKATEQKEVEITSPPVTVSASDSDTPKIVGRTEEVVSSGLQVNGHVITIEDIVRGAQPSLKALPGNTPRDILKIKVKEIIESEIRKQRDETLVFQEADKQLTDQQRRIIDAQLDRYGELLLGECEGSPTKLRQRLIREGTTLQDVLRTQRRELTIRTYLRTTLSPAISVNRDKLLRYYREHLSEFSKPRKVQMQLIAAPLKGFYPKFVVYPTPGDLSKAKTEAMELIRQTRKLLDAGKDFGEVAREFSRGAKASEGGLWRAMGRGSFRESKVEEVAFALEEGQVSDIIETDGGYYIVKVARVVPGERIAFEQAQRTIRKTLEGKQYLKLSEEYFRQIQTRAMVIYSDRLVERAVEAALRSLGSS